MFSSTGLIGDYTTVSGEGLVVLGNLGHEYVKDAISHYEEELRKNETFHQVFGRHLTRFFARLWGYKNWQT